MWHNRLGHLYHEALRVYLALCNIHIPVQSKFDFCTACCIGKVYRLHSSAPTMLLLICYLRCLRISTLILLLHSARNSSQSQANLLSHTVTHCHKCSPTLTPLPTSSSTPPMSPITTSSHHSSQNDSTTPAQTSNIILFKVTRLHT
jgi:hypothetical protein